MTHYTRTLTLTDAEVAEAKVAQAKQHDAYMARMDKHMADGMWCQMRLWDALDGYPLGTTDIQAIEAWVTATVDRGAYVE